MTNTNKDIAVEDNVIFATKAQLRTAYRKAAKVYFKRAIAINRQLARSISTQAPDLTAIAARKAQADEAARATLLATYLMEWSVQYTASAICRETKLIQDTMMMKDIRTGDISSVESVRLERPRSNPPGFGDSFGIDIQFDRNEVYKFLPPQTMTPIVRQAAKLEAA